MGFRLKIALCSLALVSPWFTGMPQARGQLIANGGFETGDFTGWSMPQPPSFPETIVSSPVHGGNFAAQIAGFLSNPNTLAQTILTSPGQDYDLSFWRTVAGTGPPQLLTVSWDGIQIFSESNPGAQPYQQFSFTVTGTGSDTLLFTCANDPGFTYLDDVSLAPVPEPSTWALLSLPLGFLATPIIRRRKKRSAPIGQTPVTPLV